MLGVLLVLQWYTFLILFTPQESVAECVSEACLVVCVERVNAVWQLKHCLSTLMEQQGRSTSARSSSIHCE